jgi:hypothetical protein
MPNYVGSKGILTRFPRPSSISRPLPHLLQRLRVVPFDAPCLRGVVGDSSPPRASERGHTSSREGKASHKCPLSPLGPHPRPFLSSSPLSGFVALQAAHGFTLVVNVLCEEIIRFTATHAYAKCIVWDLRGKRSVVANISILS